MKWANLIIIKFDEHKALRQNGQAQGQTYLSILSGGRL